MNKLNQWLTLVANLGVVIGLVLVAVEIRQNTNLAQVQTYRENTAELTQWRSQMLSDPELITLFSEYWKTGQFSELDQNQQTRLGMMINNLFSAYENAFYSYKFLIIEQEEWNRFLAPACTHLTYVQANSFQLGFVNAEFKQQLTTECGKLPASLQVEFTAN